MRLRVPWSLKVTVPLTLLGFAATLAAVNLLYHVPQAELAAEENCRKEFAQDISRLQSTLEYQLVKGDTANAQHEIAVLAHNHAYTFAALTDDRNVVMAATRRAWLGRTITDVSPQFDVRESADAIRERRAAVTLDRAGSELVGYAGVLLSGTPDEIRPSRVGSLFLGYDLVHARADARKHILQQSLYWAGWVAALALTMWLVFHFLLTRRTARLVRAAEQFAAGDLSARSGLKGCDELARLSAAFDAMALEVSQSQRRLEEDLAERMRAEEALRVSEASYRSIFEAAEDAIFIHDIDTGTIVDVNPKACATFGYTREEFRRINVGKLGTGMHPYTQHDALTLIRRAAEGEQLRIEWPGRASNGTVRWHEVFVKRATIGGHDRILALARDINARKIAEAALRASEEQYHSMFNASIDGLALWNASGEIVATNPALWRMYGYRETEVAALTERGPAAPCAYPGFLCLIRGDGSLHAEVTEYRRDSSALELELHGIVMHYQGEPHVLTIARDITDKKRAAEELGQQRESLYQREKLAALGALLAGVAHELNNPLSVVVARAVLLEEQGDPRTRAAAVKIRTAAERCGRIVRTFLAMARQQQPEHGPVAINEVVTAALDIAAYALRTSGIEVVLDLANDIPLIPADADQLHQVLLNLVINAQQSMQEQAGPRRLRLATRHDDASEAIRVTVADNGPGIPEALRARIFEPYFTTKPTGVGVGVGLAVSLGIVEAHDGTLTVDCPRHGGAEFTIVLPVSAIDESRLPQHEQPAGTPASRRILLADDEPEIRETLAEILSRDRHRVVTVSSGREALARMMSEKFDVILTDIRMPDLDGRGLYQEIERRWPERTSSVVFVTGDTLASTSREFAVRSGRPIIEKPFLPSDVRRVVADMCESRPVA
jgi:PAS domain S-box-containing protein